VIPILHKTCAAAGFNLVAVPGSVAVTFVEVFETRAVVSVSERTRRTAVQDPSVVMDIVHTSFKSVKVNMK